MVEVKVVVASVVTLLMSCALAIVLAVQENPQVLDSLPPWAQFILVTILPPIGAFLGGYVKSSPTSASSRGFVGTYRRGEVEGR
jgi:hypothetical protein